MFSENVTVEPPLVVAPSRYTADDVTAGFMAALQPVPTYLNRVRYRDFIFRKKSIGITPGMIINTCFTYLPTLPTQSSSCLLAHKAETRHLHFSRSAACVWSLNFLYFPLHNSPPVCFWSSSFSFSFGGSSQGCFCYNVILFRKSYKYVFFWKGSYSFRCFQSDV